MKTPKKSKKIVKKENIKLIAFTDEAMEAIKKEMGPKDELTSTVNKIIIGKELLNPIAEDLIKKYQTKYGATRKQAIEALVLQSFAAKLPQTGEGPL